MAAANARLVLFSRRRSPSWRRESLCLLCTLLPWLVGLAALAAFPRTAVSSPATGSGSPPLPQVKVAMSAGLAWAMTQQPFQTGDLWLFSQIRRPSAQRMVRATCSKYANQLGPFEGLVRPGCASQEMPTEWGLLRGNPYSRIGVWLYYAAAAPARTPPAAVLDELLDSRATDYLLTHQFVALELLRARGAVGGPRVRAALKDQLDRIEREEVCDSAFSDLFAERLALLMSSGRRGPRYQNWLRVVLREQEKDGRWRVRPHPYPTRLNDLHTTLLCLWSLDQYRTGAERPATGPAPEGHTIGFQAERSAP